MIMVADGVIESLIPRMLSVVLRSATKGIVSVSVRR